MPEYATKEQVIEALEELAKALLDAKRYDEASAVTGSIKLIASNYATLEDVNQQALPIEEDVTDAANADDTTDRR